MKKISHLLATRLEVFIIAGFFIAVVYASIYNAIHYGMHDSPW
jgi:hypothetical protein